MAAPARSFTAQEAWVVGLPNPTLTHIDGFNLTAIGGKEFSVFERRRSTKNSTVRNQAPLKTMALSGANYKMVSPPMGGPIGAMTPSPQVSHVLSSSRSVTDIVLTGAKDALWVALDTEFVGGECVDERWEGRRQVVSWQLMFRSGDEMVEWLIVPRTKKPLSLQLVVQMLLEEVGAPRHLYRDYPNKRGKGKRAPSFPIAFLCHAAIADVTTFAGSKRLLQSLAEAGGGLISLNPYRVRAAADTARNYFFQASLYVYDTMCFTGGASLASMGDSLGLPKLTMSEDGYRDMGGVLAREPERFAEYAMRDCEIVYRYMEGFCSGADVRIPPTAPAFAARFIRQHIASTFFDGDVSGFDAGFRGVRRVKDGLEALDDGQSFVMAEKLEPVSAYARELCTFAADAYRGGLNASFRVGWYPGTTHDHDIIGAYPLGLSAGLDPDYTQPFARSFLDEDMTLQKLGDLRLAPFLPGFGYVHFAFPEETYLPCIGVKTPNGLVFPRTSKGSSGYPATMTEVVMALRMGAKVHAERFDVATIRPGDGMLLSAYCALSANREEAKRLHGKGSPQEIGAKLMNNGGYGKVAQAIDPKERRDLWSLSMEDMAHSAISSPVHAAMGTAIVRCIIVAAVNELRELGYAVHSATTDGFITDAPLDVVENLPLCGMRERLEYVRCCLTGGTSHEVFICKHENEGLLNYTTRGNVAANAEGVLARNGLKGYRNGTIEERGKLIERIVTRTAPLGFEAVQWASAADMIRHDEDFHTYRVRRTSNPNFDLKRAPDRSTMTDAVFQVGGQMLCTPTYDTTAHHALEDFRRLKEAAKGRQLVSASDYDALFARAEGHVTLQNTDRDLVRYAVTAHRAGHAVIPALTVLRGAERIEWISTFIKEGKPFTAGDWKNAGRAERKATLPDPSVYADVLFEMETTPC